MFCLGKPPSHLHSKSFIIFTHPKIQCFTPANYRFRFNLLRTFSQFTFYSQRLNCYSQNQFLMFVISIEIITFSTRLSIEFRVCNSKFLIAIFVQLSHTHKHKSQKFTCARVFQKKKNNESAKNVKLYIRQMIALIDVYYTQR